MIQSIFIERVAVLGGYFARAVGRAAKLTWLRLIAITANWRSPRASCPTRRLASQFFLDKPTHQIVNAGELLVLPARGAWRVRKFDPKTPMKLVKSESGWALVAPA